MGVQPPSTLPTGAWNAYTEGVAWVLDDVGSTHYRRHQLPCER